MYCVLILCMYLFPFKLCTFIEINSEVFAAALEQNLLAAENKVPFFNANSADIQYSPVTI